MTQTELEIKDSYRKCLDSGIFFATYPNLTGEWEDDKDFWIEEFFIQLEIAKNKKATKENKEITYEIFEKLSKVCNEAREDLKKRLIENPDIVEQMENGWIHEIMSYMLTDERIKDLDYRLSRFDNDTKYKLNK